MKRKGRVSTKKHEGNKKKEDPKMKKRREVRLRVKRKERNTRYMALRL